MRHFLIVGAGFAGATYARVLAEGGHRVTVIDKRDHIAGNAFDEIDKNGVRIHRYGPHLFHTNNERVVEWVKRFADWVPYEHRVRALLPDRRTVPLPVNLETVNAVFGTSLLSEKDVKVFLAGIAVSQVAPPRNAADWLYGQIGRELTDLFFRPYTKKMWAMDLEEMDASVVKRIPIRFDTEDRYFPSDYFQALPKRGYTSLFERIFDHPNITVHLSSHYKAGMERDYFHCFNSMPIDEYFRFEFGELPYRSIRFFNRTESLLSSSQQSWATTNFTDDCSATRETRWDILPDHVIEQTGRITITTEEPCDYRDNNLERYYPVKTADGRYQDRYGLYKKLAESRQIPITFIGRCGTYQYLDMDQVINQSLQAARRFVASV